MIDHDRPGADALIAAREVLDTLHRWAGTAHRLVRARIAAATAAYGREGDSPLGETPEQYAARCLIGFGQRPLPVGQCTYDDLDCNTGYGDIRIGYGTIIYRGLYPLWNDAGDDYQNAVAEIIIPTWLVTDADGVERYERETAKLVEQIGQRRARENAELDDLIQRVLADRKDQP